MYLPSQKMGAIFHQLTHLAHIKLRQTAVMLKPLFGVGQLNQMSMELLSPLTCLKEF